MSTFSGGYGREEEDGGGWDGLVESSKERRERESFERIWEEARLRGRLEAFAEAMTECTKAERRDNGGMGGRDCSEIRKAIDILHLDTLLAIKKMMPVCK